MNTTEADLREQWGNPRDILSLLLLLGGDIVQKAIAQQVGHQVRPLGRRGPAVSVAPVAFSFGWVAYGFSSLLSAFGDMALMPACDHPCVLVNCATGFARENRSWALGRLLRDHEIRHGVDPRPVEEGGRAESLRVDVYDLLPVTTPARDWVWWLGWATMFAQAAVAVIPWGVYGDWTIALVTFCGTFLALVTCAMPQWIQEKWTARRVERYKVTCLTRGNGSHHIMVIVASQGAWDLENIAACSSFPRPETRAVALALNILWTCLLISVSGIKYHTWYLVCIGGVGMLQNLIAAGASRNPEAGNFHLRKSRRVPAIIGRRQPYKDEPNAVVDLQDAEDSLGEVTLWASEVPQARIPNFIPEQKDQPRPMPRWLESMSREDGTPDWLEPVRPSEPPATVSITKAPASCILKMLSYLRRHAHDSASPNERLVHAAGVHGALIEVEKWVPTAGFAMLDMFFPKGLSYNDDAVRDNVHKRFWRRAFHTRASRCNAEIRRSQQYQVVGLDSQTQLEGIGFSR